MSDFRPLRDQEIENLRTVMDRETPAYILLVQDKDGGGISFSRFGPDPNILGMLTIAREMIVSGYANDEDGNDEEN